MTAANNRVFELDAFNLQRGGISLSEDNKKLNQLHSAERDSGITKTKSTLPFGLSMASRDATGRKQRMKVVLDGIVQAVNSIWFLAKEVTATCKNNRGSKNMLCFATQSADTDVINLNKRRAGSLAPYGSLYYNRLIILQLQDLVVNPSLRAQCVTDGHFPDIEATGRIHYLKALLWCSVILTEAALICAVLLTCSKSFRLLCSFCGHSFGLFRGVISPLFKFQNLKPWNTYSYLICSRFSLMMSINLLLHLLYWVAIGITFNPTWGLSMLLIIALSVVALFVGIYNMCNVDNCKVLILLQRVVSWLYFKSVATALAEKVIVSQAGVTGMDYEIAAASVAVTATVGAAMAATEAVAVALAGNSSNATKALGKAEALPSAFHETSRRHTVEPPPTSQATLVIPPHRQRPRKRQFQLPKKPRDNSQLIVDVQRVR
ncbi:hypothetical protein pdam_00017158 [Pocillopora damicornis]|uniref:Uncharacterized protein n=1 Tax=Pocillopora damicornis TaxID=46731 RepID=A0A3M6UAI3_POCDA|nr:hypothetical protein pdam_00017158 [Pocillopora damicornis]